MKTFLAGIIQGSLVEPEIHAQDWRERVKDVLADHVPEAEVYCHYSEHPDSITYDLPEIREVFAEGNRLAGECDFLLAYAPTASMGTAIEMHEARRGGAVIVAVSPMTHNWVLRAYSDAIVPDLEAFESWAASGALRDLLTGKGKL